MSYYSQTSFWRLLKKFGWRRLIISREFITALFLTSAFRLLGDQEFILTLEHMKELAMMITTISASLLAVVIAGLAITASLTDIRFTSVLINLGILENLFFPFWWCAVLWGLTTILGLILWCMSAMLLSSTTATGYGPIILRGIVPLVYTDLFSVFYSVFFTIDLVGHTVRFYLYRGHFVKRGNK